MMQHQSRGSISTYPTLLEPVCRRRLPPTPTRRSSSPRILPTPPPLSPDYRCPSSAATLERKPSGRMLPRFILSYFRERESKSPISISGHHLKQHPKSLRAILQTSQFLLTSRSSQPHQTQFWLRILSLNSFRTGTLTPNQIVLVKWRMDMDQCSISPLLFDLVPGFWRGDSPRHLMKGFDRSPHLFRPPLSRLALRELSVIMYYFICSAIVITILFDYFERQRGNYYQISNYQSAFYSGSATVGVPFFCAALLLPHFSLLVLILPAIWKTG